MDMEQMRMAILNQEQTFRKQVHELHRVYHVQKQMMKQMQITQTTTSKLHQSPVIAAAAETKPRFEISFNNNAISHHQFQLLSKIKNPTSSAEEEEEEQEQECDLELTLATGRISSSSSSTRSDKGKMKSSNSDSGTTAAVSSTSTDSELRNKESDVTTTTMAVRFQQSESKKRLVAGEVNCQPTWLSSQCLSLRMA